jgi:protein ImuB
VALSQVVASPERLTLVERRSEVGCLMVPRFPLACEVAERPWLAGLPVAVADPSSPVVWAASPEAEADGVEAGQPLSEALGRSPSLAVLEGRPARYASVAEEVLASLEGAAPGVEEGPPGVAWVERVDRQGSSSPGWWAGLLACLPSHLGQVPPHLRPRLGVAPTKFAALVAAHGAPGGGSVAIDGESMATYLDRQPVSVLPVPAEMRRRLALMGITTLGRLSGLPRSAVVAQFGPAGGRAWDLARGQAEPVCPRARPPKVVGRLLLSEPLSSREALMAAAEQALSRAVRQSRFRGRAARRARLLAVDERGGAYDRTVTFKSALAGRAALWAILRPYLAEARLPAPVSEISIELDGLCPERGQQGELLPPRMAPQRERLEECLRQLKARYGYCPVGRVVALEPWSRIPERRLALIDFDL